MEIEQRQASKITSSSVVSKANTMPSRRRQAEQPGWAFGQKPRKGLALHRQTYIHRLSDLSAHNSADAKPCLHVHIAASLNVCLLIENSMLPSQYHPYICIPLLSFYTRPYGLRNRRECAKTPSGRTRATSMGPSTSLRHLLYMYTVGSCLLSQWVKSTLAKFSWFLLLVY